jgi:hypothetical protein
MSENDKDKPEEKERWFEMTNEEVMERLFGKKIVDAVKEIFRDDEEENDEPSISSS